MGDHKWLTGTAAIALAGCPGFARFPPLAGSRTLAETMIAVAIGIVIRTGRILIARRPSSAHLGGLWEFPGGKCHPGEKPAECLVRELREEIGLDVEPVHALPAIEWNYPDRAVRLYTFLCRCPAGEPRALSADELRWVRPEELSELEFPRANASLISDILALCAAHPELLEGR
jgi:mutator protein MutT